MTTGFDENLLSAPFTFQVIYQVLLFSYSSFTGSLRILILFLSNTFFPILLISFNDYNNNNKKKCLFGGITIN